MGSLRRYLVLLGAGCLTIGFATRIEMVWLGVAMMGASFGGLAITENLLVVHGSPPVRRTQALSGLHTMYGLAALLAPITVSISYLFAWKWNSMFLFAAVIPFAVLLYSLKEKTSPQLNLVHESSDPTPIGLKPFIWIAAFTSFYVMTEILVSSRVVLYLRTIEGYTPKQANDLLGGFFVALLAGRLVLTVYPVRVKNSTLLRGSFALTIVALCLAIFVEPLWFIASGLAMSVSFPCMIAYGSETFGAHTAKVMTWIFTGNYIGLIGMHAVAGVIADNFGQRQALLLGPLLLVLAFILLSRKPALPSAETAYSPR